MSNNSQINDLVLCFNVTIAGEHAILKGSFMVRYLEDVKVSFVF